MIPTTPTTPTTPMVNPTPLPAAHGGRLVPTPGQDLPLRASALTVRAAAGLARVTLSQTFENPHAEPLHVTYRLPLPADGAVSGFSFRIGERLVVGTVDETRRARETFERAIVEGRTAALLEEERSSLFTQELGNVPPGAQVVAEIVIDQPLLWVAGEGAWEWRFPLAAAPRYLGAGPIEGDVALSVADGDLPVRASLALGIDDAIVAGRSPESPSHALSVVGTPTGARVALGGGGSAALDRDLVVRWPVALEAAGIAVVAGRAALADGTSEACALLTLVPPVVSATRGVPRDLVVLLDTSGSMGGEPLQQAKRVASALVQSLGEADSLELIEFSTAARRFTPGAERATATQKARALAWIGSLEAGGGTEMLGGITAALAGLRNEAQRQVVVVTDGLIGFESEVVGAIARGLPRGSRVHALGVGSSTNRTLLSGIARVGAGVEVILGLGEDPERAAMRLLAATVAPVVVDLTVGGDAVLECAPMRLPDLYAGSPARLAVRVRPEGGTLVVRGRSAEGSWEHALALGPASALEASDLPAKRFAREKVLDLETELSSGRARAEVDAALVALGVRYQVATRCTSWVAVSEAPTVDPTEPTRREAVPQQLPFGMSVTGLGLRPSAPASASFGGPPGGAPRRQAASFGRAMPMAPPPPMPGAPPPASRSRAAGKGEAAGFGPPPPPPAPAPAPKLMSAPATQGAPPPAASARAPSPTGAPSPQPLSEKAKRRAEVEVDDAAAEETIADRGLPPADEGASAEAAPQSAREDAEPAAKEGLIGAIARRVRGLFATERALAGRLVLQEGDLFIVEVAVGGEPLDLAWEGVTLTWVDESGAEHLATLRPERSTRPGRFAAGLSIRIAFTATMGALAPVTLRVARSGGQPELVVQLAPR